MSGVRYTVWVEQVGGRYAAWKHPEGEQRGVAYFPEKPTREQVIAAEYASLEDELLMTWQRCWTGLGAFDVGDYDMRRSLAKAAERLAEQTGLTDDDFAACGLSLSDLVELEKDKLSELRKGKVVN